MENTMTQLLIIALAILPFATGLTQGVKIVFPKLDSRFYPVISIVVGVAVGALASLITKDYTITNLMIAGGIAGMSACGLYDIVITKKTTDTNNETK
jgi:hypothetical protein